MAPIYRFGFSNTPALDLFIFPSSLSKACLTDEKCRSDIYKLFDEIKQSLQNLIVKYDNLHFKNDVFEIIKFLNKLKEIMEYKNECPPSSTTIKIETKSGSSVNQKKVDYYLKIFEDDNYLRGHVDNYKKDVWKAYENDELIPYEVIKLLDEIDKRAADTK